MRHSMKRSWAIIALLILLSGCTVHSAADTPDYTQVNHALTGEVTVWYLTGSSLLPDYGKLTAGVREGAKITYRTFDTSDALTDAWNQAKESGSVPDLILTGYPWAYDLGEDITAQKLTDLTPYMDADVGYERDSYYGAVMDAGVYNGAQYLFPVGFTVPMVYTSEERLIEYGLLVSERPSGMELVDALTELAAKADRPTLAYMGNIAAAELDACLSRAMGLTGTSENDALSVKLTLLLETMERELENYTYIRAAPSEQLLDLTRNTCMSVMGLYNPPNLSRLQYSVYDALGETLRMLPVADWADGKTLHALVTAYGFVPADAKHPAAGYRLLRALTDTAQSFETYLPVSVRRTRVESMLAKLGVSDGKTMEGGLTYKAMGTENALWLQELYAGISDAAVISRIPDAD